MSLRFKVGDLVVRNPEVRGTSGWPYGDEVCRVVDDCPDLITVIAVVPVNSPPHKRYQDTGWLEDRFTHAAIFDPCADPPTSNAAALAEQEPVAWWHRKSNTFTSGNLVSNFAEWTPLYTSPPQRQPLTDEEICAALDIDGADDWTFKVAYAAIAAYERKNGGQP